MLRVYFMYSTYFSRSVFYVLIQPILALKAKTTTIHFEPYYYQGTYLI